MKTYSFEITIDVPESLPPLPMVFYIAKKENGVYFRQYKVSEHLLDGLMWAQLIITRDLVSGGENNTWG